MRKKGVQSITVSDRISQIRVLFARLLSAGPVSFLFNHPILFASAVFLLSRWFVVFHNNGYIYNTAGEELIYSTLAAERMRGNPTVSQMLYQEYTSGGYWLQTYLYMPILFLFGCSRYALKLLPILFSLGGFASFLYLAFTYFGRRTGYLFAGFFILGTPLLLTHQVVGYANHNELGLFFGLGMILLFRLLFDDSMGLNHFLIQSGLLGLIGGFSIFYCYSAIAFVVLLGLAFPLCLPARIRRIGRRALLSLPALLIGFALGISAIPILKERIAHPVFGYYSQTGSALSTVGLFLDKAFRLGLDWPVSFFKEILPRASCYSADGFDYSYFFLVLAAFIALSSALLYDLRQIIRERTRWSDALDRFLQPHLLGSILFVVSTVIFLLAFLAQGEVAGWDPSLRESFGIQPLRYHQMVLFMPFVFMVIALALSRFLARGGRIAKGPAFLFLVVMLFFGIESLKQSTSETPERIDVPSCVSYKALAIASVDGIRAAFPEDQVCRELEKQVHSWDPAGLEEACAAIKSHTDSPCSR